MSINPNDLINAIDCKVKIERSKDNFQVLITDSQDNPLQDLESYNLMKGDVLQIDGLGFKVSFDDSRQNRVLKAIFGQEEEKSSTISVDLKRKMDIKC